MRNFRCQEELHRYSHIARVLAGFVERQLKRTVKSVRISFEHKVLVVSLIDKVLWYVMKNRF